MFLQMSEADRGFVVCFILFSPVSFTRLYAHFRLHARIYAITTEDALASKLTGATEILLVLEEDIVACTISDELGGRAQSNLQK